MPFKCIPPLPPLQTLSLLKAPGEATVRRSSPPFTPFKQRYKEQKPPCSLRWRNIEVINDSKAFTMPRFGSHLHSENANSHEPNLF